MIRKTAMVAIFFTMNEAHLNNLIFSSDAKLLGMSKQTLIFDQRVKLFRKQSDRFLLHGNFKSLEKAPFALPILLQISSVVLLFD